MTSSFRAVILLLFSLPCCPLFASTWYVRPDGGTRYSTAMTSGQCDGTADAAYPGSGTNRHCAFKDVRALWQDGSYANGTSFPAWGWIGKGGDTYLLRGSIADKAFYRVGWNNGANTYENASKLYYGIAGDPYNSGMPSPPSGSASQHTRILGENYASCRAPGAKTQIIGGFATASVISMRGASYVDLACLDITDHSSCGRAAQAEGCNSSVGSLSDYAGTGILWSNTATHDTLTDVHIHGLAGNGMLGPTGDGIVFSYIDILGNAGAGWNADGGDGKTGTGDLLVEHFNISWNGCAEQYPVTDALPYGDCTDDNSGGYGDGFGTTTVESHPAWHVKFDEGVVSYNTQDGLDALHIAGEGSSMAVSHTLAYGNMGQQIKVGGASGVITDNQIVTNCNALRQKIPGTPAGFNKKLSDFCRAADAGVLVSVNDRVPLKFVSNIIYSASATGVEVECADSSCGADSKVDFRNNVFIGFRNDAAHGYAGGGTGEFSNPLYVGTKTNPFRNPGSVYARNTTYHPSSSWKCPASGETKANCGDPHLIDETWHLYGHGNMSPAGSKGETELKDPEPGPEHATVLPGVHGHTAIRAAECLCAGVLALAAWKGVRTWQDR